MYLIDDMSAVCVNGSDIQIVSEEEIILKFKTMDRVFIEITH